MLTVDMTEEHDIPVEAPAKVKWRSWWGWEHACAQQRDAEMVNRHMGTDLIWVHDNGSRRWVECIHCGQRLDTRTGEKP